jgi:hypothetical protein
MYIVKSSDLLGADDSKTSHFCSCHFERQSRHNTNLIDVWQKLSIPGASMVLTNLLPLLLLLLHLHLLLLLLLLLLLPMSLPLQLAAFRILSAKLSKSGAVVARELFG